VRNFFDRDISAGGHPPKTIFGPEKPRINQAQGDRASEGKAGRDVDVAILNMGRGGGNRNIPAKVKKCL